ncbi:MAG: MATE family efflux transporter [Deltaproteobacteria bacterium]|nr:MATE family efflux transporter [Deltaproteobacteria bacterium]
MANLRPPQTATPPTYWEVFSFSLPLVLGMMTSAVETLITTAYVGRLGTAELAAVGTAAIFFFTWVVLFLGIMRNAIAFLARAWGAGTPQKMGPVLAQYHWLALASIPFGLACVAGYPWLAQIGYFGPEVTTLGMAYLSIRAWDIFPFLLMVLYGALYQSMGNARFPMLIQWLGVVLTVGLNWLLIFGHWGLPAMGVRGGALGVLLANSIAAAVMIGFTYAGPLRSALALRPLAWPNGRQILELLKVGVPQGLGEFVLLGSFSLFFTIVGRLGQASLAASNIGLTVIHLLFLPAVAMGIAASSYVGRFLGAGQPELARQSVWRMWRLGMVYLGAACLPLFFWGEAIAQLFIQDAAVVALCVVLFKWLGPLELFDGTDIILRNALNGAGDTRLPMAAILFGNLTVFFPSAWWLAERMEPGLVGAWLGALLYSLFMAAAMAARFHWGPWATRRLYLGDGEESTP